MLPLKKLRGFCIALMAVSAAHCCATGLCVEITFSNTAKAISCTLWIKDIAKTM